VTDANITVPAALIGDPVRAAMLSVLCDGRAQPATSLADAAQVTPQSASNHLATLLEAGLLAVESEGRHRYYRRVTPQEIGTKVWALRRTAAGCAPVSRTSDELHMRDTRREV
jgi:DNA-binding transcriptional ArsR family regulator